MKKLVFKSKYILYMVVALTVSVVVYVRLFVGHINTNIDEVCFVICLITTFISVIRYFIVAYLDYYDMW